MSSAYLANLSYSHPQERYNSLKNSGYILDKNYNYDNYAAVYHPASNTVYHLHRGTTTTDDLGTDVQLSLGRLHHTSRYQTTERRVRGVTEKYSSANHVHIGHSLGGTLSDQLSRQFGHQSVAYNMGTSPLQQKQSFDSNHQHIRTNTDFISSFNKSDGTQTIETPMSRAQTYFQKNVPMVSNPTMNVGGFAFKAAQAFFGHKMSNFGG